MSLAAVVAAVSPFLPKVKLVVEETIALGDFAFTAHRLLKDGECSADDRRILLGKLQHCAEIFFPGIQITLPAEVGPAPEAPAAG